MIPERQLSHTENSRRFAPRMSFLMCNEIKPLTEGFFISPQPQFLSSVDSLMHRKVWLLSKSFSTCNPDTNFHPSFLTPNKGLITDEKVYGLIIITEGNLVVLDLNWTHCSEKIFHNHNFHRVLLNFITMKRRSIFDFKFFWNISSIESLFS